ncbi:hypothetical protein QBC43DRAFT_326273 [Cladorrhinum sp. PSN259]|nr:hypothetical protein QBC43DRAFT_326273 [Cladorrhinum sp. PSN259]
MKSFAYLSIISSAAVIVAAQSPVLTTQFIPLPSDLQPTQTPQTGCPTVTSTRELCASCPIPACLALQTSTQSCGCPTPIPTVYLDFPCSDGCKNLWCSTSISMVYETGCATTTTSGSSVPQSTLTVTASTSTTSSAVKPSDTTTCEPEETETETETETGPESTTTVITTKTRSAHTTGPVITTSSSAALNQTVSRTNTSPTSSRTLVLANNAGRMRVFGGWGLWW